METPNRYRSWLIGLALGVMLALWIWPATRWLVQGQLLMTVPIPSGTSPWRSANTGPGRIDPMQQQLHKVASQNPGDYKFQLADAVLVSAADEPHPSVRQIERLRALEGRFPDNPSLHANIMRYMSLGQIRIERDEPNLLAGLPVANNRSRKKAENDTPEQLAAYDHDAAEGERLDPDNAYFPFMRAIGYYASHRDSEALAALVRASQKPLWNEYYNDEEESSWRLQEAAFGKVGVICRIATAAALLFPQYSNLRTASRMALYTAVEAEQKGHFKEGYAIRKAVRQCGSLMRCQSRSVIGSLVGIAVVNETLTRPGGVPIRYEVNKVKDAPAWLLKAYDAYLQRIGHTEEISRLHAEIDAGKQVRSSLSYGLDHGPFAQASMLKMYMVWGADLVVLLSAFWMLALAAFAVALKRQPQIRAGQKLPFSARRGFGIGCAVSALLGATAVLYGGYPSPWACFAILGLAVPLVLCYPGLSWAERRRSLTACGLTVAFAVAVGGTFVWQMVNGGLSVVVQSAQGYLGTTPTDEYQIPKLLLAGVGAAVAVPALTLLTLCCLSLRWRIPLAAGVTRGLLGCAVPMACILLLIYAFLVPVTLQQERVLDDGLQRSVQSEGRYYAELAGKKWPGPVY